MKSHKEQAEAKWESDPKLREEFMDDKEAWLAYAEAEAKGMTGGPTDGAKSQNKVRRWTNSEGGSITLRTGADAGQSDEQLDAEWKQNADLRAEFRGDFECYKCYMKAEAKGLIRTIG